MPVRANSISAIFGQVLREQRNTKGISQEDLALIADVDRTFVSQMERGIRQPSITTLIKLSTALGVQPSLLVQRVEKLLAKSSSSR
jgi:transcriptional regulator with XRE-family HTH domain